MTIADVLNMQFPAEFGSDDDDFETDSMTQVYDQLDEDVSTAYGASKFVIFLNDKEVAKVPFNGSFFYEYDEETGEYAEEPTFDWYSTPDYCAVEAAVYADAVAEGIECFFASVKLAGVTNNRTPVYLAERVYNFFNDEKKNKQQPPSKDSLTKAAMAGTEFPVDWLARAYEFYGDVLVNHLIKFIENSGINDFHTGNVGFRANGAPVLLDYSGFNG